MKNSFSLKYVIICPARNEERYIRQTLSSVVHQTIKPSEMIVIDDTSTDNTCKIVKEFQNDNPWLKLISIQNGSERELGGRVVRNFNLGLRHVTSEYDFIVKMDADISFPSNYFHYLLCRFSKDEQLGIAGGKFYNLENGKLRSRSSNPEFDIGGPLKMYRKACFEDIGGLIPTLGWDHIDQMKARMMGWKTQRYEDLRIIHNRPMGSSIGSLRKGKMRWGKTSYILRNAPLFVVAKGLYHVFHPPYLIGGLYYYLGYITAAIKREQRFSEAHVYKYIRRQQRRRLLGKGVEPVGNTMIQKNKSIKICMVGHKYFPQMAIRQQRHCLTLLDEGMDVDVIALRRPGESLRGNYMGANIRRINLQKSWNHSTSIIHYSLTYIKSFISISILLLLQHLKKRYDVIYIFTLPDSMLFAGLLPKLMGAKIIADHLDPMPELYETKFPSGASGLAIRVIKIVERVSMKIADRIVTQNRGYAELLSSRGVDSNKLFVIHNGPDSRFWDMPRIPSKSVSSRNPVKLLFHGNITERSGLQVVIKALSILRDEGMNILLMVFNFGDYRNEVHKLIRDLELKQYVEWFHPMLPSKVPELIADADVGLVPNIASPFANTNLPNRIFEFLWMGKPVIVSRTAGIERYFPSNTVFYYTPGSHTDLAKVIVKSLKSADVEHRILRGQEICKKLSWEKEKQILLALIYQLSGRLDTYKRY